MAAGTRSGVALSVATGLLAAAAPRRPRSQARPARPLRPRPPRRRRLPRRRRPPRRPRPPARAGCRHRAGGPPGPGGVLVGHGQLAGPGAAAARRTVCRPRRRLRRLHRDDRELVVLAGLQRPEHFLAWSSANAAQARHQLRPSTARASDCGATGSWAAPASTRNYNGTAAEADTWGARQAARTLANMAKEHVTYPVVLMDIELPGVAPALDNGWDTVYTSPCSGQVKHAACPARWTGPTSTGSSTTSPRTPATSPGSTPPPGMWNSIFGTGSAASIPHTDEWTYEPETASLANAPSGWCLKSGGCAQFFGGVTSSSSNALMWQWSGGGGVRNGVGDFDQIDRRPATVQPGQAGPASRRSGARAGCPGARAGPGRAATCR